MQKVLIFSGRKQAGKSTAVNFVVGQSMCNAGVVDRFDINEEGKLLVPTVDNEGVEGVGILDLNRIDADFGEFAAQNIDPYCKKFSMATNLKIACKKFFGLTDEQLWGSDDDKNNLTTVRWDGFFPFLTKADLKELKDRKVSPEDFMTGREVLQYFGTNVIRAIHPDSHALACYQSIKESGVPFAVLDDIRFPNEVNIGKSDSSLELKVIRLLRGTTEDAHSSETALDNFDGFDYVLDNSTMSIKEQNEAVLNILTEWKWL